MTNLQQETFLRVKATQVSLLLDLVGELGLAALTVTRHPGLQVVELEGFDAAAHRLELLIRQVQDLASSLRLVPVGDLFRQMQRVVRDLAHETRKPIELVLEGEETELDKVVVDELKDPLLHLVRNAADHGLESPEQRRAAGKPEQGRITLKAAPQGQEIHITVADDGRGLNRAAILKRAREAGLVGADQEPDDETVWSFIFRAGFSTVEQVSNLSGRGVGMDVVQTAIHSLRGRVAVETQAGLGTRVTLVIPLTLAFLESLVVRRGQHLYAIPIEVVQQVFRPEADQVIQVSADGSETVQRQGALVPIGRLEQAGGQGQAQTASVLTQQVVVVAQTSRGVLGLPMDEIIGQQQVVMKPLAGHLRHVRGGAGCALLSSGEVAVALDVEHLQIELLAARHIDAARRQVEVRQHGR